MNPQLQGTYNQQNNGAGAYLQGGVGTTLQGSPNTVQVTSNPQNLQQDFSSTGVLGATNITQTPYYDAAAAAMAQKTAQANALKGGLTGIINNIKGVYDAIYGDIDTVGADKSSAVRNRYNKESTALADQYATDFPQIGNAFAARGTYDSSYRQDAEERAKRQYSSVQDNLALGRDDDLAKVGQYIASQRASVEADRTSLQQMQDLINASEDPAELQQLQQTLNQKMNDITASRAGLRSQDSYRAEADALVSTADRTQGLRQSLSNIVEGAAPTPLKRSVAMKLIQSSGIPVDQQQALANDFDRQLFGTPANNTQQVVA